MAKKKNNKELQKFIKRVSKGHEKGTMLLSDCEKMVKIIEVFSRYQSQLERDCLDVTIEDILKQ